MVIGIGDLLVGYYWQWRDESQVEGKFMFYRAAKKTTPVKYQYTSNLSRCFLVFGIEPKPNKSGNFNNTMPDTEHSGDTTVNQVETIVTTVVVEQQVPTLVALDSLINENLKLASASQSSGWGFAHGLLVGQLSVVAVLAFFIKFFIFGNSSMARPLMVAPLINRKPAGVYKKGRAKSFSEVEDYDSETSSTQILDKTYYDVKTHQSESLDWFNVLVAQSIAQFRYEALNNDNIYHSLSDALSSSNLPDYLDKITITEINIGDDFPIFSNCRIKHSPNNSNRLEAKIDVDVADTLTLGIETQLLLNQPKPFTAVLPVQLSVSIVRFSACLTVSLISTADEEFQSSIKCVEDSENAIGDYEDDDDEFGGGAALMFSFSPDFRLEFEVKSLIGARSKLENVPLIGNLIEEKLKSWFLERCVEPRFQLIELPSMWPRKKNTRKPVDSESETAVDSN